MVRLESATGRWLLGDDGTPCAGALGVLIDDSLGSTMLARRAGDRWPVSTEISVDLGAPPPCDGSPLVAEARCLDDSPGAGVALAQGRVLDHAGRTIAVTTMRGRYVPVGEAAISAGTIPPGTSARRDAASSTLALLAGTVRRRGERGERGEDVELVLPADPVFANPLGNTHGGVLLCASEIAGRLALRSGGGPLSTASVRIAYLRPAPLTDPMVFTAEVVHRGRTFGVARVTSRGASAKPCTVATVTCHDPA